MQAAGFFCESLLIRDDRLVLSESITFTRNEIKTIVSELCTSWIYLGRLLFQNHIRFILYALLFLLRERFHKNKAI
jgi:hypothetical protein